MKAAQDKGNDRQLDDLRLSEYESLRSELLENKRYVFERPLAVMAVAGIAGLQLKANPYVVAILSFLIWVLLVNLWFTVNRLRSNARIIAYLNLAMEPHNTIEWIGWESSLRLHRRWMKIYEHKDKERDAEIRKFMDKEASPDSMVFYPVMLGLHFVPVLFSVAASLLLLRGNNGPVSMMLCVVTILSALVFVGFVVGPWNPTKMTGLIEQHRATWLAVNNWYLEEQKKEGENK